MMRATRKGTPYLILRIYSDLFNDAWSSSDEEGLSLGEESDSSQDESSSQDSYESSEEEEEVPKSNSPSLALTKDKLSWAIKPELKPSQIKAIEQFSGSSGIVAAGLGVGKTLISLIWLLKEMDTAKLPGIVLTPKAVMQQFAQELRTNLSFDASNICILRKRTDLTNLVSWNSDKKRWAFIPEKQRAVCIMSHQLYQSLLTNSRDGFMLKRQKGIPRLNQAKLTAAAGRRSKGDAKGSALGRLASFILTPWRAVVIDEAHAARNRGTRLWTSFNWICRNVTGHCLLLSGTPIVNGQADLWSIAGLVDPAYGPSWKGWGRADKEADFCDRYLFHCKSDVPPVAREIVEFNLSEKETIVYRRYVDLLGYLVSNEDHNHSGMYMQITAALQKVRQCVNHWQLASMPPPDSGKHSKYESSRCLSSSSKVDAIVAALQKLPGKTCVFSQWSSFLIESLARWLPRNSFVVYSGDLNDAQRLDVLRQLRENDNIRYLLITYGAGGVGLNLQDACQNVILCDPWWTNATEEQAIGRVNRYGQKNPVRVLEMRARTSTGGASIETWLAHIKQHKKAEAHQVIPVGQLKLELADTEALNLNLLPEFLAWAEKDKPTAEQKKRLAMDCADSPAKRVKKEKSKKKDKKHKDKKQHKDKKHKFFKGKKAKEVKFASDDRIDLTCLL